MPDIAISYSGAELFGRLGDTKAQTGRQRIIDC